MVKTLKIVNKIFCWSNLDNSLFFFFASWAYRCFDLSHSILWALYANIDFSFPEIPHRSQASTTMCNQLLAHFSHVNIPLYSQSSPPNRSEGRFDIWIFHTPHHLSKHLLLGFFSPPEMQSFRIIHILYSLKSVPLLGFFNSVCSINNFFSALAFVNLLWCWLRVAKGLRPSTVTASLPRGVTVLVIIVIYCTSPSWEYSFYLFFF